MCVRCKYFTACGDAERKAKCDGFERIERGNVFEYGLIFKSPTTGGVRWVGVDDERKLFSVNYYYYNGIIHCEDNRRCRLKDVREVVERCKANGYTEV